MSGSPSVGLSGPEACSSGSSSSPVEISAMQMSLSGWSALQPAIMVGAEVVVGVGVGMQLMPDELQQLLQYDRRDEPPLSQVSAGDATAAGRQASPFAAGVDVNAAASAASSIFCATLLKVSHWETTGVGVSVVSLGKCAGIGLWLESCQTFFWCVVVCHVFARLSEWKQRCPRRRAAIGSGVPAPGTFALYPEWIF